MKRLKDFIKRRPHSIPALLAATMLVLSLGGPSLSDDERQIVGWTACAAATLTAVVAWRWRGGWATWLFGAMAAFISPPVHTAFAYRRQWDHSTVQFLTAIVAAFLIVAAFGISRLCIEVSEPKAPPSGLRHRGRRLLVLIGILLGLLAAIFYALVLTSRVWEMLFRA